MRVLVANRGEIAVRIIRAIKKMGYESVAIYSEADKDALHVKCADIAVCVGEKTAKESYLNVPNILSVATSFGVDAIHPGYGFLSERSDFAKLCEELGINFIGPKAETIDLMGDKINAIIAMEKANVPIIKGTIDPLKKAEDVLQVIDEIGLPVIIKAAGGGGGKGLRIVHSREQVAASLEAVFQEAKITDPNPRVYVEQFITDAKHVEIQVIADKYKNAIHLGTRDCSMQRNNQKIIEEAPALISKDLEKRMLEAAIRAVKEIDYINAGTIEFLVKGEEFYFLEMNTRLQVEHTVTEMITGIDLVELQIKIALGEEIKIKQEDVKFNGHALEARINAENPLYNFAPSPGKIELLHTPGGMNVRNDFGVYSGYIIPPFYDSMIGKIIIIESDRATAIKKLSDTLDEFQIVGVDTTVPFQKQLLVEEEFLKNTYTTTYIEKNYERLITEIEE